MYVLISNTYIHGNMGTYLDIRKENYCSEPVSLSSTVAYDMKLLDIPCSSLSGTPLSHSRMMAQPIQFDRLFILSHTLRIGHRIAFMEYFR